MAGSRVGSWLFARILRRLDHTVLRASGGRYLISVVLAGLPIVELTTIGARTGRTRTAFVLGTPYEDSIAVAGADFAEPREPGWVANLLAHPAATLGFNGRHVSVVARLADDAEFARIAELAAAIYPGSASYVRRITSRPLRAFILEPAIAA